MMKKKLIDNDEAVSPVIGVILMVAITVALAVVVFILVAAFTSNVDTDNQHISLMNHYSNNTLELTVINVDSIINYNDIVVKINGAVVSYNHTGSNNVSVGDKITINNLVDNSRYVVIFVANSDIVASLEFNT